MNLIQLSGFLFTYYNKPLGVWPVIFESDELFNKKNGPGI